MEWKWRWRCSFHGLWQFSSAIQIHASVQERLFTSQEQFQAHADWLQWYVVSSMMLFGALYFEINLSSSSF